MSDQDSSDPRHNPDEALRLLKDIRGGGGHQLTTDEAIEFSVRRHYDPLGLLPIEWTGRGRKPSKSRYERSVERRRGVYHKLVRLPASRQTAASTRRKSGDVSRRIVFELLRAALKRDTPRRKLRAEVKRLAASRGLTIPADWQLGRLIKDFFKIDTTT